MKRRWMAKPGSRVRLRHAVLIAALCATPAAAAVLEVGPQAAPGIRAIAGVRAGEIAPGDIVHLHAGHYRAPIVIPLSGTAAAPIEIVGAGDGPIEIDGSIVLDHAAFVTLRDLRITRASDAGIILRQGSHDIIVRASDVSGTSLGIWIGDHAGDGNRIEDNTIRGNATHGIAIDGVNAEPGRETVIAGNRIADNGVHGIEISGNRYIVEANLVSGNGRRTIGASGIHVYAKDAREGVGRFNIIRGNIAFDNRDATAQDGNGIQLDQWCDDNEVTGNIATGNDGAGISVFDAARARIVGNTLYGNMRDPGHSHRHKGELVFASDDTHDVDGTRDAVAEANILVATNPAAVALLVDVPTSRHPPAFGRNLLWHTAGGDLVRWKGGGVKGIAAWNALVPHRAPDIAGDPQFSDPTQPSWAGFTLRADQAARWQGLGAVREKAATP
jgi:parallel beta-helix repeat protein